MMTGGNNRKAWTAPKLQKLVANGAELGGSKNGDAPGTRS
jgi:hypothetical protein